MAALVSAALINALTRELLAAVKDVAMNFDFKNCGQNLQRTLYGLIPILEGIAYNLLSDDQQKEGIVYNLLSDDQQKALEEFYVKFQTGKTLLQKCSKVSQFNVLLIYKYAKKIKLFDEYILKFIRTMGWALKYREIQEISHGRADLRDKIDKVEVKFEEIGDKIGNIQRIVKYHMDQLENGKSASPLSIPKLPDCSDGLEISVGELKKPLLSEDVQLLGELEMGSSSNTALLTAFRNDKEFQGMMRQNPLRQFNVFINHRGIDVKNNLASFIYHLLTLKHPNLRVFFDKNEIPFGVDFEFAIETAIQSSSVHIAIFSERYAESTWCLHELDLIIKSRGKLIPVFCDLDPEALRQIEKGCYKEAFEKHRKRERLEKTKRWEDALARVSDHQGLSLKMNEDLGYCAVKIADIVMMNLKEESLVDDKYPGTMRQNPELQFDVFINFMGIDVKNRLASFIYHLLTIKDPNLRVYLDENDIPSGVDFAFAIETAIQSSSVHIAIFSEQYAESEWSLHELDLIIKSKRKLIPVFCDVDPAALRRIEKGCYQKAFEQHRGKEPLEKMKRWEDSLARASYLQGLPFKMKETDIGDFAVKIADIVLMNLKEGSLVDAKYPRQ